MSTAKCAHNGAADEFTALPDTNTRKTKTGSIHKSVARQNNPDQAVAAGSHCFRQLTTDILYAAAPASLSYSRLTIHTKRISLLSSSDLASTFMLSFDFMLWDATPLLPTCRRPSRLSRAVFLPPAVSASCRQSPAIDPNRPDTVDFVYAAVPQSRLEWHGR
jgi:hypothetical protein